MSEDGPTLRPAQPADASAIADLYLAARAAALPYLRRAHSGGETRRWIAEIMVARCSVWVAVQAGGIVGFLALDAEHVDQLYVRPGFQRRAIGSRLLDLANARSPGRLRLFTFQRNLAARAFYEAHGFRIVDMNDGARNEEQEPDVLYAWTA